MAEKSALNRSEKIRVIREWIQSERARRGVREDRLWKKDVPGEPSCEMAGEGFNLVEFQLMYSKEVSGAWRELDDDRVVELAYQYVVNGKRG